MTWSIRYCIDKHLDLVDRYEHSCVCLPIEASAEEKSPPLRMVYVVGMLISSSCENSE